MIIKIFDIIGSILILVGLWGTSKSRKYWLVYCFGTIFFLAVTFNDGRIGLFAMGIATFIIGIKNFIVDKKKEKVKED